MFAASDLDKGFRIPFDGKYLLENDPVDVAVDDVTVITFNEWGDTITCDLESSTINQINIESLTIVNL